MHLFTNKVIYSLRPLLATNANQMKKHRRCKQKTALKLVFEACIFQRNMKANRIQSAWRRHSMIKRYLNSVMIIRRWRLYSKKLVSVVILQHATRQWLWVRDRTLAAITIQSAYKRYKNIMRLIASVLKRATLNAKLIQKIVRGYMNRKHYIMLRTACIKIQRLYRSYRMLRAVQHIIKKQAGERHSRESQEKKLLASIKKQRIFQNNLDRLMKNTSNKAASTIQRKFKNRLIEKQMQIEKAKRDKELSDLKQGGESVERKKLEQKKFSQRSKKAVNAVKKYCTDQMRLKSKTDVKNDEIVASLTKYHRFSLKDEVLVTKKEENDENKIRIESKYKDVPWYNNDVAIIMEKYGLEVKDIQKVHSIFKSLDYNNSDKVRIIDFFDNLQEPKTQYSIWIFEIANASSTTLKFHEYMHVIAMISLFGKYEIYQLLFSSSISKQDEKEVLLGNACCMNLKQFEYWMNVMCDSETVPRNKKAVIRLFDRYSKADPGMNKNDDLDKKNLFFDGFVKVSKDVYIHTT